MAALMTELITDPRLFWDKILVGDDCWEWTGPVSTQGYGAFNYRRQRLLAHRVAWELWNGLTPSEVSHACQNKLCCRPTHLSDERHRRFPAERFWEKVRKTDGCWEWTGANDGRGYGVFNLDGAKKAYRVAWTLAHGEIPDGLELDHLCRNKLCVRPEHLEPVTHAENMRRGESGWAKRTHCIHGHEFTSENTYLHKGVRHCRACAQKRVRQFWNRKREVR